MIGFVSQFSSAQNGPMANFPNDFEKISEKKMGGSGSGRAASHRHNMCNELLSIDLAWLRRKGLLVERRRATITWSHHEQQVGTIDVVLCSGRLQLLYRCRENGGDWKSVDEMVPLEETAPALGGKRL